MCVGVITLTHLKELRNYTRTYVYRSNLNGVSPCLGKLLSHIASYLWYIYKHAVIPPPKTPIKYTATFGGRYKF